MRKHVFGGLVVAAGLLAAVDLGYHIGRQAAPPIAFGQTAGGSVVLAAANSQTDGILFVYNSESNQLASYVQKGSGTTGLELKGIRKVDFDFSKEIDEYPKSTQSTAVSKMRDLINQLKKK